MLALLAGSDQPTIKLSLGNVLVLDFDIELSGDLMVKRGQKIAFAYSGSHEHQNTNIPTENSMIYFAAGYPESIATNLLSRIDDIESGDMTFSGIFTCYTYRILCEAALLDPLFSTDSLTTEMIYNRAETGLEWAHTSGIIESNIAKDILEDALWFRDITNVGLLRALDIDHKYGIKETRCGLVFDTIREGNHLIFGEYYSPNQETWKKSSRESLQFPEYVLKTSGQHQLQALSIFTPISMASNSDEQPDESVMTTPSIM